MEGLVGYLEVVCQGIGTPRDSNVDMDPGRGS